MTEPVNCPDTDSTDCLDPLQETDTYKGDREKFIRQFPKNLASNIALFLINVGVGLWLVPFLIHNLGVAAYGMIPLAMSLTHYVALVTLAVSGGISRFLTIDLHQNNLDRANRTFNTSFWCLVALILSCIPFLVVFTHFVPVLFNVPTDEIVSSKWLFAGVIGAFLLSTLSGSFGASTFAYNRLDLRNYVQILRSLVRLFAIVALFLLTSPSLENVALATIFSACAGLAANFYFWRRLTPQLTIDHSFFDSSRLKDLLSMGGWLLVNHVGFLLFLHIDLIVVNRLFGPGAGGEYASVLQWSTLLRTMAGILSGLLAPMYMISYAKGNIDDLIKLSKMAVKFMGLGLAVPIGLACGLSKELLTVWIGPEFSKLAPLMVLLLIHLTVNLAVLPLFSINVCCNKVKVPGVVTLFMGLLNLVLAVTIPLVFDTGFYGVAIAGAIVLTLKNALFTPWYATKVLGIKAKTFISEMALGILATLAVLVASWSLSGIWLIDSWVRLILSGCLIGLVYAPIIWFAVLSKNERKLLIGMARRNPYARS